jgi:hypothetical protein
MRDDAYYGLASAYLASLDRLRTPPYTFASAGFGG